MYNFSYNQDINVMLNQVVNTINDLAEIQLHHIENLTQIGQSLSSETDLDKVFDLILEVAIQLTNADGATIYRVSDDNRELEFEIVYSRSLNTRQGGTYGKIDWPKIPLYREDATPRTDHIITSVFHSKCELCFDDVYETKDFDISSTIQTDEAYNYRCKSMLLIPLKNHENQVLGIIQMINATDKGGEIITFNEAHRVIMNSLASQAAIALSNRRLIENMETLLLQFMRSIASGIVRKSKYSSDHIIRVARLTDMFALKLNDTKTGKYAEVNFTDSEIRELSMAGLMHDVGKIVTPETIMDKGRKLEIFRDNIDTVELRFFECKLLCRLLCFELPEEEYKALIRDEFGRDFASGELEAWLDGELRFLQDVNLGQDRLTDAGYARIERLAQIRFNYAGRDCFLLSDEERENLQIRRGTLSASELVRMNAHVAVTWEMLSQLSFPQKYKNVAFYASTHHEKLDGTGYPFGYSADNLPLQSRIIAIADIFEAVTANDRPYKHAHTLSGSLKVLAKSVTKGELDEDLLDFFLDSGLYLDYAQEFMHPEQFDPVDVESIKAIYC